MEGERDMHDASTTSYGLRMRSLLHGPPGQQMGKEYASSPRRT